MLKNRLRLAAFLFFVFTSACFATEKKTLRIRTFGDPLTFDWNRAYTPVEATLLRNLMEGLLEISSDGKLKNALAEKWETSNGGRVYTFYLRKDVKWSDGISLDASQFVESWKRLLDPEFKANYAYLLFDVIGAEAYNRNLDPDFSKVGIKALNAHTLQVTLKNPIVFWKWIPTFWATFPIRTDLISAHPQGWATAKKLVSLGPFLLSSYEKNRRVILEKNPTYYGKRGNVDEVISALAADDVAAVQMYKDGHLDFITKIPSSESTSFQENKEFVRWTELRTVYLNFNTLLAPMNDRNLREAIALAADKQRLVEKLGGHYQPANSFAPPGIMSYQKFLKTSKDLSKSKLALKKSSLGTLKKPLVIGTIGFTDEVMVAEFLKEQLQKDLNLECTVQVFEPKEFYSPLVSLTGVHILVNRWTADYPDPDNFFTVFLSSSGNNRMKWQNARYDELIKKARLESKDSVRLKHYTKAQKILIDEDRLIVPLYYGQNAGLVRSNVKGFKPSPTNSYLFKDFSLK